MHTTRPLLSDSRPTPVPLPSQHLGETHTVRLEARVVAAVLVAVTCQGNGRLRAGLGWCLVLGAWCLVLGAWCLLGRLASWRETKNESRILPRVHAQLSLVKGERKVCTLHGPGTMLHTQLAHRDCKLAHSGIVLRLAPTSPRSTFGSLHQGSVAHEHQPQQTSTFVGEGVLLVVGPLARWPVGPLPVLVRARQRPTAWPMATRCTIVTLATC